MVSLPNTVWLAKHPITGAAGGPTLLGARGACGDPVAGSRRR
eukprot:CAMPEP_0170429266 /NCGR_PEP_ID=MMETSP0117_2-20130122/40212_1 /TAXON_ID=400756 /ORGANISM="Durinskia baltica, Strain CSIRO CS-38" /LENGTH=41 /DNA_ID= /DNA_START= /DNA_END= /DNA_ORIENTATION=